MSKDTLQILEDARALVADENTWTKGIEHMERDITVETGRSFLFGRKSRTITVDQYCVIGAIKAASGDALYRDLDSTGLKAADLVANAILSLGPRSRSHVRPGEAHYIIPSWNDSAATHDSVLKVFDMAIQAEKDRRVQELRAQALKGEQIHNQIWNEERKKQIWREEQKETDRKFQELHSQPSREDTDRRLRELLDSIPEPEVEHAPVDDKVLAEV